MCNMSVKRYSEEQGGQVHDRKMDKGDIKGQGKGVKGEADYSFWYDGGGCDGGA